MSLRHLATAAHAAEGAAHAQRRLLRPTLLVAAVAPFLLAACVSPRVTPHYTRAPAVAITCDAACVTSCAAPLPRWTGDPGDPATWDNLGDLVAALRERIDGCDAARAACVRCLVRLDRVGVTCGTEVPCDGGEL